MTEVYKAINKVMAVMAAEGISKNRNNSQQGYRFRGIDDVYNSLSRPMVEAGLVVMPRVLSRECTERQTKSGSTLFYVVVDCEFDFIAVSDGSKHTVKTFGEAMDSADKATNKAMSAAMKYAYMQAFCIPTEGDNDADAHTPEPAPKQAPKPQAKPQAKPEISSERLAKAIEAIQAGKATKESVINNFTLTDSQHAAIMEA